MDEQKLLAFRDHFVLVAHVELFRRKGWLEPLQPLSAMPEHKLEVRVTDEGFKAAEQMRVMSRKLFH